MNVEVHTDAAALARLSTPWRGLAETASIPSLFVSWEWASAWWDTYGGSKKRSLLVLVCKERERIVGIAPLCVHYRGKGSQILTIRTVEFIGSYEFPLADYLGFLTDPRSDANHAVTSALVDALFELHGEWDAIDLANTLPEQRIDAEISARATQSAFHVSSTWRPSGLQEELRGWDEYLARRSRTVRKRYRWERNRLSTLPGFRIEAPTSAIEELDEPLEVLAEMHNSRIQAIRGQPGSFERTGFRDFARRTVSACHSRGWVWLWTMRTDDACLASALCFFHRGRLYYFLTGRSNHLPRISCGQILLAELVHASIAQGAHVVDLLEGDEPYKRHWASRRVNRVTLRVSKRTLRGAAMRMYRAFGQR